MTMSRRRWWTGSTGKQRPSGPSGPAAVVPGRCHFSKRTFRNFNLELSGDHGLDGVYGVGQLGKRLGLVLARTTSQQARVHDRLAWDSTSRFHITIPHRSDVRDSPLTAGSDEYRSTADLLPFPEGEVDEVRHP